MKHRERELIVRDLTSDSPTIVLLYATADMAMMTYFQVNDKSVLLESYSRILFFNKALVKKTNTIVTTLLIPISILISFSFSSAETYIFIENP